jgi:hypothetical protein
MSNATVGGAGRVEACLRAAIKCATVGSRNSIGHWLTCRCTDAGLDFDATMKVMWVYRAGVPSCSSYTAREVQATVRSRFRRLARKPSVNGEKVAD